MGSKYEEMNEARKYIEDSLDELLDPRFDNIDNVQFHKLRDRYRKSREALHNYILKHSDIGQNDEDIHPRITTD